MTVYKSGHPKRALANKDESAAKKWKLETMRVKFKANINGVIKDRATA